MILAASRRPPAAGAAARVAAVVPAHEAAWCLGRCLEALRRSDRRPDEVVVVDDGSGDDTATVVARAGARVIRLAAPPSGPAAARNRGAAAAAEADLLLFVDSDVVVRPDAVRHLVGALERDPGLAAAFGSYDDRPPSRRAAALYANLRHHLVHQRGAREARTFWAGLGVVRRSAFLAVGGFDERRFGRPSIEDVELGLRLSGAGRRIALVPEAQGTHLKEWTVTGLWRTDVMRRAVPWSVLMARDGLVPDDLNTRRADRVAAAAAHAVWLGLALGVLGGLADGAALALSAAGAVVLASLSAGLLRLLHARGGWRAAAAGAALHWLYLLYASATFVVVAGATALGRRPAAGRPEPEVREP